MASDFVKNFSPSAMESRRRAGPALTIDMIKAIFLYTLETPLYHKLNQALRADDAPRLRAFFPYLRLLTSGLRALCSAAAGPQLLTRGVKLSLAKANPREYQVGQQLYLNAVTSTSTACTQGLVNTFMGRDGDRTLFQIVTSKSADISCFSEFGEEEAERILLPGTVLRLTGVVDVGHGLTVVQAQDITPAL